MGSETIVVTRIIVSDPIKTIVSDPIKDRLHIEPVLNTAGYVVYSLSELYL